MQEGEKKAEKEKQSRSHTEELQLPSPLSTSAEATMTIQMQDMNPWLLLKPPWNVMFPVYLPAYHPDSYCVQSCV